MKVAFWRDLLHNPHNAPELGYPSELQAAELIDILKICKDIPVEAKKGEVKASIFPFVADKFYRKEEIIEMNLKTDGALLDDIDHCNDGTSQIIYDSFELLCKKIPNLYAMWFSQSKNLHVTFYTEALNSEEYAKQELWSLLYLAQAIEIVTGIKLDDTKYTGNIDDHNKSISQRFRLNRVEEFKYNEDYIIGNFPELDDEKFKEAKKKWPTLCSLIDGAPKVIKHNIKINSSDKIRLTDVGKHSYIGHSSRWKLYDTLVYIFKDKAMEMWNHCCEIMTEANGHTIEFYKKEPVKNRWVERYTGEFIDFKLAEEFGIFVEKKAPLHLEEGEYLSKYDTEILDFIKENDRCCIQCGTGAGKTTLVNGDNYGFVQNLSKIYNAIVIVPYNITNNLYSSSIEIGTQSGNYKIRQDESCVMVWDQAVMHWDEIKDRNMIIDECHRLYLDVDWRDKSIMLLDRLKEKTKGKIIMFSATPSGEIEELYANTLKITNWHRTINTRFIETAHIDLHQIGYIKSCYNSDYYDRIVLFDDMTMKKVYENLIMDTENKYDILYARSETKETKEVRELLDKEILTHKLTLCTRSYFEGLNFNNTNEKILVLSSFRYGKTTSNLLVQQSGRIRNSDVTFIVFFDDKDYTEVISDESIENAKTQAVYAEQGVKKEHLTYDSRLLNERWVDINRKMLEWVGSHSNLETVIDEMNEFGYFNIKTILNDEIEGSRGDRLTLKYKKLMSDEFKEEILNDDWESNTYVINSYKYNWQKKIRKIIYDKNIEGANIQHIKDMITKGKDISIETILDKFTLMINVACETEQYWNNYNKLAKEMMKELSPIEAKKFSTKLKHLNSIRKEVNGKFRRTQENIIDVSDLFLWMVEQATKEQEDRVEKNRDNAKKGGKLSSPKKKVKDTSTGTVYASKEECAKAIGKSKAYVSKYKDRFVDE